MEDNVIIHTPPDKIVRTKFGDNHVLPTKPPVKN